MKTIHLVGCIKRDIMRWVNRNTNGDALDLSVWTCGIATRSNIVKLEYLMRERGETTFKRWMANEFSASVEIMKFFSKNGMKSKMPKNDQNSNFVFVLKADKFNSDEVGKILDSSI